MQVCSFRCIVSYESALLQDFSLCILQKNNCLGLSADIPAQPDVQPMTHFKGQPLSHEQAGVQVRCHHSMQMSMCITWCFQIVDLCLCIVQVPSYHATVFVHTSVGATVVENQIQLTDKSVNSSQCEQGCTVDNSVAHTTH